MGRLPASAARHSCAKYGRRAPAALAAVAALAALAALAVGHAGGHLCPMRLVHLATLATLAQLPGLATCGRSPAAGVTYDCPDGRAFTVTHVDSTTAVLALDGETRRLVSAAKPATRWVSADSTWTLSASGDTAVVTRGDSAVRAGCVVRNPELRAK